MVLSSVASSAAKEAAEAAAKKGAKEAAETAAKNAAKEAAEAAAKKGAKEAAESIAKETAERLAKELAQETAEAAAKRMAKEVAEAAAKKVGKEAAEVIAKKAAMEAGEAAIERTLKEAGENILKKGTKEAIEQVGDSVDDVVKAVGKKSVKEAVGEMDDVAKKLAKESLTEAGQETAETTASKAKKFLNFIKRNPKSILAGTAAVSVASAAGIMWAIKNDAEFIFTKMEKVEDNENALKIHFELGDKDADDFDLENGDHILLTENDSTPMIAINKVYKIISVDNDKKTLSFEIPKDKIPSKLATRGKFLYKTDFISQLGKIAEDTTEAAVEAGTKILGGALDGAFQALGIPPPGEWGLPWWAWWVIGGILLLLILLPIGLAVYKATQS
jgi:hypothetical protein